jgi:hypothetical protein
MSGRFQNQARRRRWPAPVLRQTKLSAVSREFAENQVIKQMLLEIKI